MDEPNAPETPPQAADAAASARAVRREVQLEPALQAKMLAQMHEEQATALRQRELTNWVLVPIALFAIVIGTIYTFSHDMVIAFIANTIASGVAWVLWRVNRERIRDLLGR